MIKLITKLSNKERPQKFERVKSSALLKTIKNSFVRLNVCFLLKILLKRVVMYSKIKMV